MASVQHYVCDAEIFPLHIIEKHAALEDVEKERHFAALKIQRLWRGYVVRKEIARWHYAATVLQKYIRGFLLRWHLPEILREYLDWYRLRFYNRMATKIQALWRGYFVRKDRVPIKELLARRRAIEKANEDIQRQMREAFENMERQRQEQMEKEAQQWVLYILFKLHHHLRTRTREGIYSLHGKTFLTGEQVQTRIFRQLSSIEQLLKILPLQEYMQELKDIYYREVGAQEPPRSYIFKTKKLQKMEDIYKNRDRSRETKETFVLDRNIHDKPFVLTKKLIGKAYEKSLLSGEKYTDQRFSFARTVDKTKHVCDEDFDLHVLKKVIFKLKPPPYYIDFWSKICEIHNIPDL